MNLPSKIREHLSGLIYDEAAKDRFAVTNPANGDVLAYVKDQGASETSVAITAAYQAFPAWSALTAKARSVILKRWSDLVLSHAEDLAKTVTLELGRVLSETRGEVTYGASFLEWFGEEAKRAYGRTIPAIVEGKQVLTIKQPLGVCAAITPWNFPISMITRKVAPALAAGCTVVIKPSEETPLCALVLGVLARQAGLPEGVLNLITTTNAAEVGAVMTSDARVKKLSFTGSTPVGKRLYAQCAPQVKKVSLELGGNAPFLVFDDADMEAALDGIMVSKFRNSGQTCVCANRILIQSGIYERFMTAFQSRIETLKVKAGWEDGAQIGPLINTRAISKIDGLISEAVAKGASVVTGGKSTGEGAFFTPTLISGVTPDMAIFSTEIFGPVAAVCRFETEADGIGLANDSPFGLAAYVFTRDLSRALRVSTALEVGMVGLNDGVFSSEVAPFGGVKESGIGREGAQEGLEEYLNTKMISIGGLKL